MDASTVVITSQHIIVTTVLLVVALYQAYRISRAIGTHPRAIKKHLSALSYMFSYNPVYLFVSLHLRTCSDVTAWPWWLRLALASWGGTMIVMIMILVTFVLLQWFGGPLLVVNNNNNNEEGEV